MREWFMDGGEREGKVSIEEAQVQNESEPIQPRVRKNAFPASFRSQPGSIHPVDEEHGPDQEQWTGDQQVG